MAGSLNRQWTSFFDENLLEEWCPQQPILLVSPQQQQQPASSARRGDSCVVSEKPSSRKRHRDELSSGFSKACREKMRRDKFNDKFMELSSALEPGRPVKIDKSTILSEAACVVQQLREEVQQLKASNEKLRDAVRDLKVEVVVNTLTLNSHSFRPLLQAEKNELREEKIRLKEHKERLEEQVKAFSVTAVMPHPAAIQAATAAFVAQQAAPPQKAESALSGMAMWQWIPPTSTDISQDHLLRPPAA